MLEQIDLELLTTCGFRRQTLEELPKSVRHPANIRWIGRNDNMVIMRPQFTKDIQACFSVLIPEMNRRWFVLTLEQDSTSHDWHAEWFFKPLLSDADGTKYFAFDPQPQIAISKAAYAALKGEKC